MGPVSGGGGDVEGGGEVGREGGEEAGSTKSGLKVALGFRVCEFVLCLISFSVMASDKTEGWSGDSFDRYKEYRFFNFPSILLSVVLIILLISILITQ